MAKEIKMPLPSAADLFSTQEERDNESRESVREIPLGEISDFPNHPFQVNLVGVDTVRPVSVVCLRVPLVVALSLNVPFPGK